VTTEDIIIHIFCKVDDKMPDLPKHSQAKLYPSELVTIGLLFALKGGHFRAFYRWLKRDYDNLFAGLPDRTRLQRALKAQREWLDMLLADATLFTVIDTYPIELLFPIREGRSEQQIGKKGRDKGRWSIGIKLCWLLNKYGSIVGWDWDGMNVHDKRFHPVAEAVADSVDGVAVGRQRRRAKVPDAEVDRHDHHPSAGCNRLVQLVPLREDQAAVHFFARDRWEMPASARRRKVFRRWARDAQRSNARPTIRRRARLLQAACSRREDGEQIRRSAVSATLLIPLHRHRPTCTCRVP